MKKFIEPEVKSYDREDLVDGRVFTGRPCD